MNPTDASALSDDGPVNPAGRQLGAILFDLGRLSMAQVEETLATQRRQGGHFGQIAVALGFVGQDDIETALSRQLGHPTLLAEDAARMAPALQRLVADEALQSHYRNIRAQLELRWFDQTSERRTLAVLGSRPGEGCTTTVAMLGLLLAQIGARVLLIDACLAAPHLARMLGARNVLPIDQALADAGRVRRLQSAFESFELAVVGGGGGRSSVEMLHGRPFIELLSQASAGFDAVLIDCPPAQDALTLATRASGALIVARLGRARVADLQPLGQRLRDRGVELVGAVGMQF